MSRTHFLIGVGLSEIADGPETAPGMPHGTETLPDEGAMPLRNNASPGLEPPIDTSDTLSPLTEVLAAVGGEAAPREPVAAHGAEPPRERRHVGLPVLLLFATLLAVNLFGLSYYLQPIAGRVRSPLHDWFRPSGYVGQSAGLVAFAFFVFIWLYPLRKRVRWMASTGSMKRWLDLHIVAGLAIPVLGAMHASWRFQGLIGLGYVSMLVVCASGIVGKYIYTRIPRRRNGIELSLDELGGRRRKLIDRIVDATGMEVATVEADLERACPPARSHGLARTIVRLLLDDLTRWRAARVLRRKWTGSSTGRAVDNAALVQVLRLAKTELALTQRARMLESTHALFRFWHVAHLPFAITALVAVVLHVAVVVALGATWLW